MARFRRRVQRPRQRLRARRRTIRRSTARGRNKYGVPILGKRKALLRGRGTRWGRVKRRRFTRKAPQKAGQLTFAKMKVGYTRKMTVPKVMRLLGVDSFWRYQGVNGLNSSKDPKGYFVLDNRIDGLISSQARVPLHIYGLNIVHNRGSSGNPTSDPCGYELRFDDEMNPIFASLSSQNRLGADTAAAPWSYEGGSNSGGVGIVGITPGHRYWRHDWYDIRLNMYGAKKQPTYYDVMLVRFTAKHLDPIDPGISGVARQGGATSDNQEVLWRKNFWQSMVRNLITNPILMGGLDGVPKGMTVVKRRRFVIQPSTQDDLDTSPDAKVLKLFMRDGKIYDYEYGGVPFSGPDADTSFWGGLQNNATQSQYGFISERVPASEANNLPKHGARLYLMIRASNTTVSPRNEVSGVFEPNSDATPSYDLCMRRKTWTQKNAILA